MATDWAELRDIVKRSQQAARDLKDTTDQEERLAKLAVLSFHHDEILRLIDQRERAERAAEEEGQMLVDMYLRKPAGD